MQQILIYVWTGTKTVSVAGHRCLTGYTWLAVNHHHTVTDNDMPVVCLFKHTTGIPCPSCGSTRAVLSLLNGDIANSLLINPAGLLIALILIVAPVWIVYDMAGRKATLFSFYRKAESFLQHKPMAITVILLVLANWVWNIIKGL